MFHCTRVKERGQIVATIVITLLSVIGKTYAGILVYRVRKVTEGLIDNVQEGFRAGSWCIDQIFTLKQIGKKAREKM